jgi:hypothetical protein
MPGASNGTPARPASPYGSWVRLPERRAYIAMAPPPGFDDVLGLLTLPAPAGLNGIAPFQSQPILWPAVLPAHRDVVAAHALAGSAATADVDERSGAQVLPRRLLDRSARPRLSRSPTPSPPGTTATGSPPSMRFSIRRHRRPRRRGCRRRVGPPGSQRPDQAQPRHGRVGGSGQVWRTGHLLGCCRQRTATSAGRVTGSPRAAGPVGARRADRRCRRPCAVGRGGHRVVRTGQPAGLDPVTERGAQTWARPQRGPRIAARGNRFCGSVMSPDHDRFTMPGMIRR